MKSAYRNMPQTLTLSARTTLRAWSLTLQDSSMEVCQATVSATSKIKGAPSAVQKARSSASENHALVSSIDWRAYSGARSALPYGMVQKEMV